MRVELARAAAAAVAHTDADRDRLGLWLSSALCLWALATLGWTLLGRLGFPYPLEWMEGGVLHHALRLGAGQPLYAPPSAEFISYLYPPLAYLPIALSVELFGASLPAARLPSLLALVVTLIALARAAGHAAGGGRGARRAAGAYALAVFAMGYGYAGAFLDLARVDALFICLLALGTQCALAGRARAALSCFALSLFAKQHGVLFLAAYAAYLLRADAARYARSVIAAVFVCGTAIAALQWHSEGFFLRYVWEMPRAHRFLPGLFFSFFAVDLFVYLPLLCAAVAIAALRRRLGPLLAMLLVAALLAGALGRAHPGGHDNVRLPALLLLSIAAAARLLPALAQALRRGRRFGLCALLIAQVTLLWQPPSYYRPPVGSRAAFSAVRAAAERCAAGGRAVALDYPLLTGQPYLHTMALSDLRMMGGGELAARGTRALLEDLAGTTAPRAIVVGERFAALQGTLEVHYRRCAELMSPRMPPGGHWPGWVGDDGVRRQRVYRRTRH